MVCAGMGADTMISILESAPWLKNSQYRLVLQCQSRRPELRKFLYANGWHIARESLVKEGKFYYPIMEVVYAPGESLSGAEYYITPALIADKSPLFPEFLARVVGGIQTQVDGLARTGGEKYEEMKAVLDDLKKLQ
jgi:tRNA (adenine22-N1)-methyltransferase